MLAEFKNVRVLDTGVYDIDGAEWRWIDCYDPDGREKVVRYGVVAEVAPYELAFGDMVDLTCDVRNETKVLKGTDRTYVRHNVRIQDVRPAKSSANGRAATPTAAVA